MTDTASKVATRPDFGFATDVGRVRDHNEDALLTLEEHGVWAIADGMGGHEAGEVASQIALDTLKHCIIAGDTLEQAIQTAHRAILDAASTGKGAHGMGCTLVALRLSGARYEIAWVGDSRAYLWSHHQLKQLSHDHSFVQQLMDHGLIDQEQAEVHPNKSVLTQALGHEDKAITVDTLSGTLFRGEALLLCSDGVSSEIDDERMARAMNRAEGKGSQVAVDNLISAALKAGGSDNATAIVVAAPMDAPERSQATLQSRAITPSMMEPKGKRWHWALGITGIVTGLLLVLAALWYLEMISVSELGDELETLPRVESSNDK